MVAFPLHFSCYTSSVAFALPCVRDFTFEHRRKSVDNDFLNHQLESFLTHSLSSMSVPGGFDLDCLSFT